MQLHAQQLQNARESLHQPPLQPHHNSRRRLPRQPACAASASQNDVAAAQVSRRSFVCLVSTFALGSAQAQVLPAPGASEQQSSQGVLLNRDALSQDPSAAELCPVQIPGVAEAYVAPSGTDYFPGERAAPSISAALAEAPPNVALSLRVAPGRYYERLVLDRPNVSIVADSSASGNQVEVIWETAEPYQSVVDCSASNVRLRGLVLHHSSKSVANNYGVFIRNGSNMWMDACDVSSSSGSGVGIEGAAPLLTRCRIHGCANHGVAVFGPLEPEALSETTLGGAIRNCTIEANKGDGIKVGSAAEPSVSGNTIKDNKGSGMSIQNAGGQYFGNAVMGNGKGGLQAEGFSGPGSKDQFASENKVVGAV